MAVDRGSLRVLATAGDTFLGGDDFDAAIVAYVRERFHREHGDHLSNDHRTTAQLNALAEQVKCRLSNYERTMFTLRKVMLVGGAYTRLEMELSRVEIENVVEPLVARTFRCMEEAMREAGVSSKAIQEVLLIGGQTRMPFVRAMVRKHLGVAPRCELNPDEVVAFGAGIFAHLPQSESLSFQDVLPMSIGIAVGGKYKPLIARNTNVPCTKAVKFTVSKARFSDFELQVWQGDAPELHRNEPLGTVRLDAVAPGESESIPLRVDFSISPDCLLRIALTNCTTGESQHVLMNTRD